MTKKNLRMAFRNEISALKSAQEYETEERRAPSHDLETMIQCWERALQFLDEKDPYPVVNTFAIGGLDPGDSRDLMDIFVRRGNRVTVENSGDGLIGTYYRIKVEGYDAELLGRQFDGSQET